MTSNTVYTPEEVAKLLKISRFTVYELIKRGELPAYRIGRSMRIEGGDFENYISKSKSAITANAHQPERPEVHIPPKQAQSTLLPTELIICGKDLILDVLAGHLERDVENLHFLRRCVDSMASLTALYNGAAHIASAHLWDADSDQYNVPYARYHLPGQKIAVVNLVHRYEGFYVAPGNPKRIAAWTDLTRPGVRFVNRGRGSGTRVLLDEKLRKLNINHKDIQGYEREEMSHLAVASCVASGEADVGLGMEKTAMQVSYVEFIPLQRERYDLVMLQRDLQQPHFQALLRLLRSPKFQNEIDNLGGYDTSQTGEIIAEI